MADDRQRLIGQESRFRPTRLGRLLLASSAVLTVGVPLGSGIAVFASGSAGAATDQVTNCDDSGAGSLRQAVADATSGDTIDFALSCSIITLTSGDIEMSSNLTINGPGESVLAVSGNDASRVFQVDNGATVSIGGLTIEDGSATNEGGGILNDGALTLTSSTVSKNTVGTGSGGGAGGGGLANEGTATVTASSFTGNVATSTGYGALGGAIYNDDGSLTVTNAILSGNAANNTASGTALGGAISNGDGNVKVAETTLANNSADSSFGTYGGAISNGSYGIQSGTVTVVASTLSGNTATGTYLGPASGGGANGGGLNNYGTVAISESTVVNNTATTNSSYSFGGVGGGINNFGTMSVTHTTFAKNSANSGSFYAASINSSGNDLTIMASIVAQGSGRECYGPIVDLGYNIDDDGSCGFTGTGSISDSSSLDATLGMLANNGGATDTIELSAGSPAIDAVTLGADCSGNDQRGAPWPTPCDMGALQSPTGSPPTTSILIPSIGATLSGSTYLDASASNATSVEFLLFGGTYGFSAPVLCTATPTLYGWLCAWNTTTVPDGTYTLVSLASNSAGSTFSSGVNIVVNNNNSPPTTRVLIPSNGATLSGSTYLDASATNATSVAFVLFGGTYGFSDRVLCTATPTLYGWLCAWNTTTVPDGTYTLFSGTGNSAGIAFGSGVSITVKN
jgi:hypothetical protein